MTARAATEQMEARDQPPEHAGRSAGDVVLGVRVFAGRICPVALRWKG